MDANFLLTAKALHIIFIVSWFAGLFYMPRLFIYQTEALIKPESEKQAVQNQLKIMAKRLWYIISWPACIITILTGVAMILLYPPYLQASWMQLKLGLVVLLLGYHISLHWLFGKLQRDQYPLKSTQLRFYNELATILLFAIVFTVTFKNTQSWMYGVAGLLVLGIVLSLAILMYKRMRKR